MFVLTCFPVQLLQHSVAQLQALIMSNQHPVRLPCSSCHCVNNGLEVDLIPTNYIDHNDSVRYYYNTHSSTCIDDILYNITQLQCWLLTKMIIILLIRPWFLNSLFPVNIRFQKVCGQVAITYYWLKSSLYSYYRHCSTAASSMNIIKRNLLMRFIAIIILCNDNCRGRQQTGNKDSMKHGPDDKTLCKVLYM